MIILWITVMDHSIGIYIHIPFCKSKCYYCDFNSYSGKDHLVGLYFDALLSEMTFRADKMVGRPVRSVFIGGGTPSLVDPKNISSLLEVCSKHYLLDPDAEISLESNPGTLTQDKLKAYRAAGVNRLSIGLQAWQDRLLEDLGRIHRRQQFIDNLNAAYCAGFTNINVDLIFGLPGQRLEDWAETLEAVTSIGRDCGITHLSCYSLQIESGTRFGDMLKAGTLKPAGDELDRSMYRYTVETLAQKGYKQYEISNFAKTGFECKHNLIYWKALEYAGFGAGAHSYIEGKRFGNIVGIEEYLEAVGGNGKQKGGLCLHEDIQQIDKRESMAEFMLLGLRLTDGVCAEEFEERFGESMQVIFGDALEKLEEEGLLVKYFKDDSGVCCFKLTLLGLDLANKVFIEFV